MKYQNLANQYQRIAATLKPHLGFLKALTPRGFHTARQTTNPFNIEIDDADNRQDFFEKPNQLPPARLATGALLAELRYLYFTPHVPYTERASIRMGRNPKNIPPAGALPQAGEENALSCPVLEKEITALKPFLTNIELIKTQPCRFGQAIKNLETSGAQKQSEKSETLTLLWQLSDDALSQIILRTHPYAARHEKRVALPGGTRVLLDSRQYYCIWNSGYFPIYTLVATLCPNEAFEKWLDNSATNAL